MGYDVDVIKHFVEFRYDVLASCIENYACFDEISLSLLFAADLLKQSDGNSERCSSGSLYWQLSRLLVMSFKAEFTRLEIILLTSCV